MSTIFKRTNGIFYLVLVQPDGSRRWISTKTRNRSEALRALAEHEAHPKLSERFPKLSEFIAELLPYVQGNMAIGTAGIYKKSFQFFLDFVSDIPIDKITHRQIDQFKTFRLTTVKKNTLNVDLRCLRAGFENAVRWQILDSNPFRGIKLCSIDEKRPMFLSPVQYKTLILTVKEPWLKQMIILGALTGLRRNELLNLTWQNIDLERRIIYLFSTPTFRTKNGKTRVVPLNESAVKILQQCFEIKTNESIFSFTGGKPVSGHHVSHTFKKYVMLLNLDPGLSFHGLQHTIRGQVNTIIDIHIGTETGALHYLLNNTV